MFAGAPDLRTYWQNILAGVDAVSEAGDRWARPYFDPGSTENDRIYTRKGGFLGEFTDFDPVEFGIMPTTVEAGDPDHFLALKLSRLALQDAGYGERSYDGENTGIILGRGTYVNRGYDTLFLHGQVIDQTLDLLRQFRPDLDQGALSEIRANLKSHLPAFTAEAVPSLVPNVMTGRIANRLNLMGPNYIVDAACASSLIAIELAVKELREGRCDMMLTGGVHTTTPPQLYMMFCLLNALSRSDLRPFDQAANGTLLGEGLGILVLKRAEDAVRDGDRIYAVIKGLGSSSDGRALGLLAPRQEGEVLALRRAYEESGVDPRTIGLIEAHGTGMPVGDRTEIQSIAAVFGARGDGLPVRALGSVKSMIGHCIPAAGVAGVIKTALALYHKILPPSLCAQVNPQLGIDETSAYVNNVTRPWIHGATGAPRRAGVNAFGFGGVNAHAILEEHVVEPGQEQVVHRAWPTELVAFAADTREDLHARARQLLDRCALQPSPPLSRIAADAASSAAGGYRLAFVCADAASLRKKLEFAIDALASEGEVRIPRRHGIYYCDPEHAAGRGTLAMLFPGEGGQYQHMLQDLCLYFPRVRAWFDLLDRVFADSDRQSPSTVLFPPPTGLSAEEARRLAEQLFTLDTGSPVVFIASLAIYRLLRECGVGADVMLGHSTGEGTALIASNTVRIPDDDALLAGMRQFDAAYRGFDSSDRIPRGALMTVGAMEADQLHALLAQFDGRIHLALDNCPNQMVVFGSKEDLEQASARIRESGGVCMPMPFDRAYHTPLFASVEGDLRALYESLEVGKGDVPVVSCTTAGRFPDEPGAIRDLAARMLFSEVRFRDAIESLYADGVRTFVEVGPGGNLTTFVRDTLNRRAHHALAANVAGKPGLQQFQTLLGQLFAAGFDVNFAPLYAQRGLAGGEPAAPRKSLPAGRRAPGLDMIMPGLSLDAELARKFGKAPAPAAAQPTVPVPAQETAPMTQSVLDQHFSLMQEFLAGQARMLEKLTGLGQDAPAAAGTAPQRPLSDAQSWPLLDTVEHRDEKTLHATRTYSLATDRFLVDHTLGGRLSRRDPALHALPVVPFTVSMEACAQAAQRLLGKEYRVRAVSDARGYRMLALDEGTLVVGATAARVADGPDGTVEVLVRLFQQPTAGAAGAGQGRHLVFEAHVHLARSFGTAPRPRAFDLGTPGEIHYTREMYYAHDILGDERYAPMFHGPCFHGVRELRQWGRHGIEADLVVTDLGMFFADRPSPAFQTDPALIDAAGQLIGFWVAERFGADLSFFPFRVHRYEQFAPVLPTGAAVRCRARIRLVSAGAGEAPGFEFLRGDGRRISRALETDDVPFNDRGKFYQCELTPARTHIEADFEFLDAQGNVLAVLDGWHDHYFSVPHHFYRCRVWPDSTFYSEALPNADEGVIVRRIVQPDSAFMGNHRGLWQRVLGHLLLTPGERVRFAALPGTAHDRSGWLLGRAAAKDAVRQWARQEYGLDLAPAEVEILDGPAGRISAQSPALADKGASPNIFLSESTSGIIAVLTTGEWQAGANIARRESQKLN